MNVFNPNRPFKLENFNCQRCQELARANQRWAVLAKRLTARNSTNADVIALHGGADVRVAH